MARTGYCNGSDMLLYVGDKAIGHCTSHTATFSSETKDRAVKPLASVTGNAGLWKDKTVIGLAISLNADGLVFYAETEYGFKEALTAWKSGAAVTAKCMRRSEGTSDDPDPYLVGSFIITSLERTDPANDDATFRIQLENSGEPTELDPTAIEAASS